jgi:hypothetical protein
MKQDALSEQEQQMLHVLHEWPEHPHAQLVIELRDGGWEIAMTVTIKGEQHLAHGVGPSFNEAWHNMNPTEA